MRLYHGGTTRVDSPLAHIGRDELDFGKGFYLTTIEEQACRWGRRLKFVRNAAEAYLNIYDFDREAALAAGHVGLSMNEYNQEWLDFVTQSRKGRRPWEGYDFIEGGVANDQVIDTVEDYLVGRLTVEQALGQLRYARPNHQMCILSQRLIDSYLHFVDCIII